MSVLVLRRGVSRALPAVGIVDEDSEHRQSGKKRTCVVRAPNCPPASLESETLRQDSVFETEKTWQTVEFVGAQRSKYEAGRRKAKQQRCQSQGWETKRTSTCNSGTVGSVRRA